MNHTEHRVTAGRGGMNTGTPADRSASVRTPHDRACVQAVGFRAAHPEAGDLPPVGNGEGFGDA